MLMALEVGIGLGAYVSGSWFASEPGILLELYGMCAGFGVLGFAFLNWWKRVHKNDISAG
jgi:hypothetical protein